MKVVVCDQCQKKERLSAYGNAPVGWMSVTRQMSDTEPNQERHYCSAVCAVVALNDNLTEVQRPLLKAEA